MSTRQQRGRLVGKQHSAAPRAFYILIASVAVIGFAALGVFALRARQNVASPGALISRAPLSAPTGKTPEGYYYKGNPDAPVTVTEYSDFQCPFCAVFAASQALTLDQSYVETGKIKYIFHDYPLQQHPNAVPAAQAGRCAGDQNAFWPMHDMLFANQKQWQNLGQPLAQFTAYAAQLKLDTAAFNQCVASGKYATAIDQGRQQGNQIQIPGTPTFVIDNKQYDAQQLPSAIEAALAAQQ